MKLIVGLGNPGKEYKLTRHNFGFIVLDKLAEINGVKFKLEKKLEAEMAEITSGNEKLLLAKPQTFMNNSGVSVQKILNFYKIEKEDLLLVYDDKDLNFGDIRTAGSSSAGHRGVESIIQALGTKEIARVRLGIANGSDIPTESFVLQRFTAEEQTRLEEIIKKVLETTLG